MATNLLNLKLKPNIFILKIYKILQPILLNKKMEMSSEASPNELLLQSMAEEENNGDAEFLATQFPDWQLIDEISIRLLEQGIGTFDTLQRALPSVALAQIEEIHLDSNAQTKQSMDEKNNKKCCSAKRMLKLFRLAQLQIKYLLKSQQEMVEKVTKAEERAKRLKRENKALREQFTRGGDNQQNGGNGAEGIIDEGPQWGRELFRCNECTKIFLHANFLTEHIQRRHGGNLESATRLSSVKNKAERVLAFGDREQQQSTSMTLNEDGRQWGNKNERNRTMKRKNIQQQRGQSQSRSGTFRKRTDQGGGEGRSATEMLKSRQQQNWHQQDGMDKSSCPSSSFGEDIAMALPETSSAGKEPRKTLTLSEEGERG